MPFQQKARKCGPEKRSFLRDGTEGLRRGLFCGWECPKTISLNRCETLLVILLTPRVYGRSDNLLFIKHQGVDIAGTVNHAHDNDLDLRETVVQRVIAVKMRPQPLGQIIPSGANLRLQQEGGKTLFNLPDKLRGGGGVILGDEAPDID